MFARKATARSPVAAIAAMALSTRPASVEANSPHKRSSSFVAAASARDVAATPGLKTAIQAAEVLPANGDLAITLPLGSSPTTSSSVTTHTFPW